jgi:hypothetical protein
VSVPTSCTGSGSCALTLTLTTTETLKGTKLVALAAAAKKRKKVVVLGGERTSIPSGHSATVTTPLNARGKRLLERREVLPLTLTIKQGNTGVGTYHLRLKHR